MQFVKLRLNQETVFQYMLALRIEKLAPGMVLFCAKVAKKKEKPWKGKDRLEVSFNSCIYFVIELHSITWISLIHFVSFLLQIDITVIATSWH